MLETIYRKVEMAIQIWAENRELWLDSVYTDTVDWSFILHGLQVYMLECEHKERGRECGWLCNALDHGWGAAEKPPLVLNLF